MLDELPRRSSSALQHTCGRPLGIELELGTALCEIAEMASHAMVIILARSAPESHVNEDLSSANIMSSADIIKKTISDAETQLLSDQPPMRARAIVQLRQLARGPLEELCTSAEVSGIMYHVVSEWHENAYFHFSNISFHFR